MVYKGQAGLRESSSVKAMTKRPPRPRVHSESKAAGTSAVSSCARFSQHPDVSNRGTIKPTLSA